MIKDLRKCIILQEIKNEANMKLNYMKERNLTNI